MAISLFDRIFAFVDIAASSLGAGGSGSVLVNLRALNASDTDVDAEQVTGAELYGVTGFLFRPRDQDVDGAAEGIAARLDAGMIGVASRDLRVWKARGALDKGSISMAGYSGAHITILDARAGTTKGRTETRQPTQLNSTAPHVLALDGAIGAEVITVHHALGHEITMDQTGKVTISGQAGVTTLQLTDAGGVVITKGGGAQPVVLETLLVSLLNQITAALAQAKAAGATPSAAAIAAGLSAINVPTVGTVGSSALSASP